MKSESMCETYVERGEKCKSSRLKTEAEQKQNEAYNKKWRFLVNPQWGSSKTYCNRLTFLLHTKWVWSSNSWFLNIGSKIGALNEVEKLD